MLESPVSPADLLAADFAPRTDAAVADRRPGDGGWLSDFAVSNGRVRVFDTGADLVLDRTLIGEILVWLVFHLRVRLRSWRMAVTRPAAPRIWFTPRRPRPWYLIWSALAWSGLRIARSPDEADACFAFEDVTWSSARPPSAPLPAFNFGCPDIAKSTVAATFEAVFGYPLALDPAEWRGPAVEKGEANGAHDGRIVDCPAPRLPGRHYQRLIDTGDGRFSYDLRTPCIGGRPVAVWVKRKPSDNGFSIHNLAVELRTPEAVFSAEELDQIGRFLAAMRIDWAGLDILRDRHDGRIYIVDVNKTDVGPIIALPWRDKIRSTRIMAKALEQMVKSKAEA